MDNSVVVTIYNPPAQDLPFLVVSIFPDGKVQGVAAPDALVAQQIKNEIAATIAGRDL
jgi:hypothetical protein